MLLGQVQVYSDLRNTVPPNGKKVLVGFIGSGYLCWGIVLVYYLLVYNPHQTGFSQHINPIDAWVLGLFRKYKGGYSSKWGAGLEKVRSASICLSSYLLLIIDKCVIMLGDQQIITGIAILGGAYSQLDNGFQLYHWQMSIWLAWFSSVTHLGTLSVLRNYLREHPLLRALRLFLMLTIAIMLVVSLLPTGSPIWLYFPGEYAGCYFRSLPESWKASGPGQTRNNAFLAITTVMIIATSYLIQLIKMFHGVSTYSRIHLRVKPGRQIKRSLDALSRMAESVGPTWSHWTILIFYNPFLVAFLIVRAGFDLMESMLWEVGTLESKEVDLC